MDGGKTTKRKIIVRACQLASPSLFDALSADPEIADHINLPNSTSRRQRTYAIDVNILFDVTRHRESYERATTVIRSSLSGDINLCVTDEFLVELQRNAVADDPILEFAKTLPKLPVVNDEVLSVTKESLRNLIFPDRDPTRRNAEQDQSDLTHIAMAIHHEIDGFITREKSLLAASNRVREAFGVDVVSADDFYIRPDSESTVSLKPLISAFQRSSIHAFQESERTSLRSYLSHFGLGDSAIQDALRPGTEGDRTKRFVLKINDEVVGYTAWQIPRPLDIEASCFLFVNEEYKLALQFIEHILTSFARDATLDKGRSLRLFIGANQEGTLAKAINRMYRAGPTTSGESSLLCLQKLASGSLVTRDNWTDFVAWLADNGLQLESKMPGYEKVKRDGLKIFKSNNVTSFVKLEDLETYLENVLILFHNRPALVIPIRPTYAEELLGTAGAQHALFGNRDAWMKFERTYFRSPRNSKQAELGGPVVFYASGDTGAAIGYGRVTRSKVDEVESIDVQISSSGVLTKDELADLADQDGNIHIVSFSGFQPFVNRVRYKELKDLGIGQANFQTLERINFAQLTELMRMGLQNGE